MNFAFVFPGQGSQALGMADQLLADFPARRERFDAASERLGLDLAELISKGPVEKLNRTEITQPALLAVSVAVWDSWLELGGPAPQFVAGHSFGEYSALVCAGSIAYEDGVEIVSARGRFMQEAAPPDGGAVAAILGIDGAALREICAAQAGDEVVQCANYNAPGQIAIAGHSAAVTRAGEAALAAGAKKVVPLAVSAPVHTEIMRAAADRLGKMLAGIEIKPPKFPVVHNVDVSSRVEPDEIRAVLYDQMFSPVRWSDTVEYFVNNGVTETIECGPGKVLSALVKRTNRQMQTKQICDRESVESALEEVKQ